MTNPEISEAALDRVSELTGGGFIRPAFARYIQTTSDNARAALTGYNDAYCPATHLEKHLTPIILPEPKDPFEYAWEEAQKVYLTARYQGDGKDAAIAKLREVFGK